MSKTNINTLNHEQLGDFIVKRIRGMAANGDDIQSAMLRILDSLREAGAREVCEDVQLLKVFQSDTSGRIRSQLGYWVETYTPIRIKWERTKEGQKTGRVDGLKLARKGGEWNLSGAKVNPWYEVDAPYAEKALSKPDVERGIKAVIREVARLIDVDSTVTLADIKAMVAKEIVDNFAARVLEEQANEKHQEWVKRFEKERAEAERVKASREGQAVKDEQDKKAQEKAALETARIVTAMSSNSQETVEPESGVVTMDDLDNMLVAELMKIAA